MASLRHPETGCAWDLEQNFASIAPYTIEEAYEVADAVDRGDLGALKDELGDLLLQVVFHSQMAQELGAFTIDDVVDAICEKMVRRHPHVFGDAQSRSADGVKESWESIKAQERAGKQTDDSALADVAIALPALLRAQKLQNRARRTGFDWPDLDGAMGKLAEEIEELKAAETQQDREEEMGDVLFAAVNVCRHLDIDAEAALKSANAKFERRFRSMERLAETDFSELSLEEKEALWNAIKRTENEV